MVTNNTNDITFYCGDLMTQSRFGLIAARSLIMLSTCAAPALAQTEEPAAEEIVVTARKRAEQAVDVPVSLSVYDQQTLRRTGADDFADIADAVPGVSFATVGVGASRVFIRGIGQVTTGQSPTTAFYLDDILLNQPRSAFGSAQPDPLLADIARVEVLRGPQGALFGASALGGAVRLIGNRPDPNAGTLDVNAALGFRRDGGAEHVVSAAANLPLITDRLALRMVGVARGDGGWIDDLRPAVADIRENLGSNRIVRDVNRTSNVGGRMALAYTPDAATRVQVTGLYQQSRADGLVRPEVDPSFGLKSRLVGRFQSTFARDDFTALSLVVDRQVDALGGFSLTSATTYSERDFAFDFDNTPFGNGGINEAFPRPAPFQAFRIRARFAQETGYRWATQELRAATTRTGPFSLVAGLYLADARQANGVTRQVSQDFGAGVPAILDATVSRFRQGEYAAFGEAGYEVLEGFTLNAGGRLYHYRQRESATLFGRGGPAANPDAVGVDGRLKETGFSPRAVASYRPRRDVTLYASYAEGFRTGGVNAPIPDDVCPASVRQERGIDQSPEPFDSDKVRTYEVGAKAALFGGKVTAEAAAYDNDWVNYQQSVQRDCGPLGSVATFTANAGRVRSRGFEAEVGLRPLAGLALRAGAAHTDVRFREDVPVICISAGDRLTDVPRWTYSGSVDYEAPLGRDLRLVFHADARRVGSSISGFGEGALVLRPAYTLVGASAGFASERFEAALFVRNLTDETPIYAWEFATSPDVGGSPDFLNAVVGEPRTIGVRLTARLGR